jgi:hypothetical protein
MLFTLVFIVVAIPVFAGSGRGKVGELPKYPKKYEPSERNELFLIGDPQVVMGEDYRASISFKTAVPCPAACVYFGVYEPDKLLPIPRYRSSAVEKLDGMDTLHQVVIELKNLMNPAIDVAGLLANDGGMVAYRLELYHPLKARSFIYDRRFEFSGSEIIPTIIKGPLVDMVSDSSAMISWQTDQPVFCTLFINDRIIKLEGGKPETRFEKSITDLNPGTVHKYWIIYSDGKHSSLTRKYFFRTANANEETFSFAVMGDSREGFGGGESACNGVNLKIMRHMAIDAFNRGVDFIIHTGDLVNGYTTSSLDFEMQLAAYKDAVELVAHYIPIYEMMGNHEFVMDIYQVDNKSGIQFDKQGNQSTEAAFAREFVNPPNGPAPAVDGMPPYQENVYHFDHGNCRFIVMNNNYWNCSRAEEFGGNIEGYVLDDQLDWLKQVFADAAADTNIDHVFLYAHEPMFPTGGHADDAMWYCGGSPEKNDGVDRTYIVTRRDEIWEAFAATGKAVAGNFGDEHNYSRTLITPEVNPAYSYSVWQIISGGVGAPFYVQDKDVPWAPMVQAFSTQMNYTLFRVDGMKVTLEVYSDTGELLDEAVLQE